MIELGEILKKTRNKMGVTQDAFANAIGVTAQAVSRWENGICFPDIELLPSIANYFHVSIDELFGYNNDRTQRIEQIVNRITEMNCKNDGVDNNIGECIALAREALLEFPGDEQITYCLASVLYNAGYVRHGEFHLTDGEGYDVYDVAKHRTYTEWKEAIVLYEKLLNTLKDGQLRWIVVQELTQLYLNMGETERALAVVDSLPVMEEAREMLKINATDGKARAQANGEALLSSVRACARLMVCTVISYQNNMSVTDKVQSLQNAIRLYDLICPDGNLGPHHLSRARLYSLLSCYLWMNHEEDEAFAALDQASEEFDSYNDYCRNASEFYTSPLLRLVPLSGSRDKSNEEQDAECPHMSKASLAEDWPWWRVPGYQAVKKQMQSDPRWNAWLEELKV